MKEYLKPIHHILKPKSDFFKAVYSSWRLWRDKQALASSYRVIQSRRIRSDFTTCAFLEVGGRPRMLEEMGSVQW